MRFPSCFSERRRWRGPVLALALCVAWPGAGCRPAPGKGATLRVAAPEADRDADVYVDGNYVGQINALSAAGTAGLQLAPGVHRVEIRKAGRFPVQRTITVERNGPAQVTVEAELLENPE